MSDLTKPYGAPNHTSADPVLDWVNHFWGKPVRVRVIGLRDEHWLRGVVTNAGITVECLFTRQTVVEVSLRDEDGEQCCFWIDTTAGGHLVWDSPARRELRTVGNNGCSHVFFDDGPVRRIDMVEAQLALALAEDDPVKRHETLGRIAAAATIAGDVEPDDALRSRLVALSVFLEEYRDRER